MSDPVTVIICNNKIFFCTIVKHDSSPAYQT